MMPLRRVCVRARVREHPSRIKDRERFVGTHEQGVSCLLLENCKLLILDTIGGIFHCPVHRSAKGHTKRRTSNHNQRTENVIVVEPTRSTQHYESSGALAGQICGHWSCRSHEIVRSIVASCGLWCSSFSSIFMLSRSSRTNLAVLCFCFSREYFLFLSFSCSCLNSEWAVNQHRDSYASYIGHYPTLCLFAVAENEPVARTRYNFIEKMIQPCGPPPATPSSTQK